MPSRAKTPCSKCRVALIPVGSGGLCDGCRSTAVKRNNKEYNKSRGSAWSQGYNGYWRKLRKAVLKAEPLCRECMSSGRVTAANEVHHLDGNPRNNDMENLAPLCKSCHSSHTARDHGWTGGQA